MTVRLRPHHLLCVLTYRGAGYSAAFCANFDHIAARIAGHEEIEICAGPDDVCAPLLVSDVPHCFNDSVVVRDAQAADAVSELLGFPIINGATFKLNDSLLDRSRHAFADGTIRAACTGCEWQSFCTDIAARDFAETRLKPAI